MTSQHPLFAEATPTLAVVPPAPRCRMCARDARWITKRSEFAMYCGGSNCTNRDRICQSCGEPFTLGAHGAGTKYCSTTCKTTGYRLAKTPVTAPRCAWCDTPAPSGNVGRGVWPYVCTTCTEPLRYVLASLRRHKVPHEMARQLLTDPTCQVCGTELLTPDTTAQRAALVVDHDHTCCPGATSCGRCVRGFLCNGCNAAAGLLRENPDTIARLGAYLSGETRFSRGIS